MRLLVFGSGNKLGQAAYHTFQVLWGRLQVQYFRLKNVPQFLGNKHSFTTELLENKNSDLGNPKVGLQIIQISITPLKTNIYHINIP